MLRTGTSSLFLRGLFGERAGTRTQDPLIKRLNSACIQIFTESSQAINTLEYQEFCVPGGILPFPDISIRVAIRWLSEYKSPRPTGALGMRVRLTEAAVRRIEPTGKRFAVYDETLPGFGLMIQAAGAMSFFVEYRPAGAGRSAAKRRIVVGKAPSMRVDDARATARKHLANVSLGGDPAADRTKEKGAETVASVVDSYLADAKRTGRLKPRSYADYHALLHKHVVPRLGTRKLRDVRLADLASLHNAVSKGTRTKAQKGAPIAANRMLSVFSAMWGWASKRGWVAFAANPVQGVERHREKGRERFLTDDEIGRLGSSLRLAETDGLPWLRDDDRKASKHDRKPENQVTRVDPRVCDAIRLLLLSGMRRNEVLHLQWSEVDPQRGMLHKLDTKTGRRSIILSEPAMEIILRQPREKDCLLVFPGRGGLPRSDVKKPWLAIIAHANLEGLRLHDLRHSAASVAAGAGVSLQTIGAVLGHSQIATTARYAHLAADRVRRATETIAARVQAALGD